MQTDSLRDAAASYTTNVNVKRFNWWCVVSLCIVDAPSLHAHCAADASQNPEQTVSSDNLA